MLLFIVEELFDLTSLILNNLIHSLLFVANCLL